MTEEMKSSISAVTDQIERLASGNNDLKNLVLQIRGLIGQDEHIEPEKPTSTPDEPPERGCGTFKMRMALRNMPPKEREELAELLGAPLDLFQPTSNSPTSTHVELGSSDVDKK